MAYENRFEQYDIFMDRPPPLVPRHLRLPIPERMTASGDVLEPLVYLAALRAPGSRLRATIRQAKRIAYAGGVGEVTLPPGATFYFDPG